MKKSRRTLTKNNGGVGDFLKSRETILFLIFCFLILIVVFRMYYLQIVRFDKFSELADNQHHSSEELLPNRGEIFLKNKDELYPLAINRDYFTAFVSPREIPKDDIAKLTDQLVSSLGIEKLEVENKLRKRNRSYEVLKYKIPQEEKEKIEEKGIIGLHFEEDKSRSYRFYSGGELAAHVVGFIGSDGKTYKGRYGIEKYFEDELAGSVGRISQRKDARGGWLSSGDREFIKRRDGVDIILTIEYAVQYEIERILKEAVEEYEAEGGSISVMDPKTGKILAMASYPTFDPNDYSQVENMSVYTNPIVSNAYESGSVFKSIVMAIGLDEKKITPDTTYVDEGFVKTDDWTLKNANNKVYGLQTMTQVLENSINTGMIYVEKLVGNKKFRESLQRFGFDSKTNIELPTEVSGNFLNLENLKSEVEFYTASYGQGITVTQLQLLTAYSALANGGNLMKPQIIEKKIFSDGNEEVFESKIIHRVISEESSRQISEMLRSVVENGHGENADVPGYLVCGKTGTAEVASKEMYDEFEEEKEESDDEGEDKKKEKAYEGDKTIVTFAGYAPLDDPQFVVVVKIDNPSGIWATNTAAPTFSKVMAYLLDFYDVEPTEEIVVEEKEDLNIENN